MKAYELGFAYGQAFVDGGCDIDDIITDFGESCVQEDFIYEIGVTLGYEITKDYIVANMQDLENGMKEAIKCLK